MKKTKIFLGGTVDSNWRDELIPKLEVDYFNPIVPDWTEEDYKEELKQRKICDFVLYCITPKMTGVYAIAEVIDDSNKQPEKTLFFVLEKDEESIFSERQKKSLIAVGKMVVKNGGKWFTSEEDLLNFLNK